MQLETLSCADEYVAYLELEVYRMDAHKGVKIFRDQI